MLRRLSDRAEETNESNWAYIRNEAYRAHVGILSPLILRCASTRMGTFDFLVMRARSCPVGPSLHDGSPGNAVVQDCASHRKWRHHRSQGLCRLLSLVVMLFLQQASKVTALVVVPNFADWVKAECLIRFNKGYGMLSDFLLNAADF